VADIVLRCEICKLPWAKIRNGVLIVESRHHGAVHVNVIAVSELEKLATQNAPAWLGEVETKEARSRE
jgi:hypothetical protein